jgi:opacity protein-like surface antigen
MLVAGAAAAAIAAAPAAAAAAVVPSCVSARSVICQSPGNIQINNSPVSVPQAGPYGPLYGGYARGHD